jgi:hypothetical protein
MLIAREDRKEPTTSNLKNNGEYPIYYHQLCFLLAFTNPEFQAKRKHIIPRARSLTSIYESAAS